MDENFYQTVENILNDYKKSIKNVPSRKENERFVSMLRDKADEIEIEYIRSKAKKFTYIAELPLGVRTIKALEKHNIRTIDDLRKYSNRCQLLRLDGIGTVACREIIDIAYNHCGIKFF